MRVKTHRVPTLPASMHQLREAIAVHREKYRGPVERLTHEALLAMADEVVEELVYRRSKVKDMPNRQVYMERWPADD
jgi:hypothetical protein